MVDHPLVATHGFCLSAYNRREKWVGVGNLLGQTKVDEKNMDTFKVAERLVLTVQIFFL